LPVYVVRHAKAGNRSEWQGDDRLRPLTKAGRKQAEALAQQLRDEPLDEIRSSDYLRCMQTVEPLATARGLPVHPEPLLEEGAGGESVLRLIKQRPGRRLVLCTHGDVVEELLELLVERGLLSRSRLANEKGGTWVLEERNGDVSGASYRAAP
jgi:8-oxo-dGTP diphosphatase